jgi:hypothetical protein
MKSILASVEPFASPGKLCQHIGLS